MPPLTDTCLQFGVPPWHPDGTVNEAGVPVCTQHSVPVGFDWKLDDYTTDSWKCKKCGKNVPVKPREAAGKEPVDWWWCKKCKESTHKEVTSNHNGVTRNSITRYIQKERRETEFNDELW